MKNLFGLVAAGLLAVGCQTTPEPPPYVPQVNVYYADRQEILDPSFVQWMPISEIRCTDSNDGVKKLEAKVKNATTSLLRAKYRVDWLLVDGSVCFDADNSSWEKVTLKAGQTGELRAIAPDKKCVGFRLSTKLIEFQ